MCCSVVGFVSRLTNYPQRFTYAGFSTAIDIALMHTPADQPSLSDVGCEQKLFESTIEQHSLSFRFELDMVQERSSMTQMVTIGMELLSFFQLVSSSACGICYVPVDEFMSNQMKRAQYTVSMYVVCTCKEEGNVINAREHLTLFSHRFPI